MDWNFSQNIRDNVMEALSGVKGDNSVKIFGPDLDDAGGDRAGRSRTRWPRSPGVENVGVFRIKGQSNLEFPVDRQKCAGWDVQRADVQASSRRPWAARPSTQMSEGEKSFDVTVRWPQRLRPDEQAILDIPVDVGNTR